MPFAKGLIEVKTSELQGRGLFCLRDIAAGTVVWRMTAPAGEEAGWEGLNPDDLAAANVAYSEAEMMAIEKERPQDLPAVLWGGYMHEPTGKFIHLLDGGQFTNHSETPTCGGAWGDTPETDFECVLPLVLPLVLLVPLVLVLLMATLLLLTTPSFFRSTVIVDLKKGDEILDDYGTFRDMAVPWLVRLFKEHSPDRHAFESTGVAAQGAGVFHKVGGGLSADLAAALPLDGAAGSWAALVGADGQAAVDAIKAANARLEVLLCESGGMFTMDFREDRVRVMCGSDGKVDSEPRTG